MKKLTAHALLDACARLDEIFAQERKAKVLSEELLKRKEKILRDFQQIVKTPGGLDAWSEKDLRSVSQAAQKLYTGALATARFSDLKARLSRNIARMLGHRPPAVTYTREGAKESRADSQPRIDRVH